MAALVIQPETVVGNWRRFGVSRPLYEVVAVAADRADGQPWMRIRTLEHEEELDYPLREILDDPREL